jgi:hypothetical protein
MLQQNERQELGDYITGVLTDRTIDHSHRCGANKQGSYVLCRYAGSCKPESGVQNLIGDLQMPCRISYRSRGGAYLLSLRTKCPCLALSLPSTGPCASVCAIRDAPASLLAMWPGACQDRSHVPLCGNTWCTNPMPGHLLPDTPVA